jgi:predicted RNA-binding protein with RPS1 domain
MYAIFKKLVNAQDDVDAKILTLRRHMKNIRTSMRETTTNARKLKDLENTYREKNLNLRKLQNKKRNILDASANFYKNRNAYTPWEMNAMSRDNVNAMIRHIKSWSSV